MQNHMKTIWKPCKKQNKPLLGTSKPIYVSSDDLRIDMKPKETYKKAQVISQPMIKNNYFYVVFISDGQTLFFMLFFISYVQKSFFI